MKKLLVSLLLCSVCLFTMAQTVITDKNFTSSGKVSYVVFDEDYDNVKDLSDEGLYFAIRFENGSPYLRLYYPSTQKTEMEEVFRGAKIKKDEGIYYVVDDDSIYFAWGQEDGKWIFVFFSEDEEDR